MGRKLVIIGAGSAYTPELFEGVFLRNETLKISEITLVDIPEGEKEARIIYELGKRMIKKAKVDCQLHFTLDRRQALKNADFVISQIRVGGWQARGFGERLGNSLDLVGQETTGVGGFASAMYTIPEAIAIAKDMENICPEAWLINFTNPSGVVTEAILKHTNIKCIGLCNVPVNMHSDIAKVLNKNYDQVHCTFLGLNHLSFVTKVLDDTGADVTKEVVDKISSNATLMKNIPKVDNVGDLIKTIGIVPSPYLQYYFFELDMKKKQQKELKEDNKTRADVVHEIDQSLFEEYSRQDVDEKPARLSERGGSLYSFAALNIIEALLSDKKTELVVNVSNNGSIEDLKDDDVVEVNCYISNKGVEHIPLGILPPQVSGVVETVKQYERLLVEAAVSKDKDTAVEALLNHPLLRGYNNALSVVEAVDKHFGLQLITKQ